MGRHADMFVTAAKGAVAVAKEHEIGNNEAGWSVMLMYLQNIAASLTTIADCMEETKNEDA